MIDTLTPYPAYKESGLPWLGQVPEHWEIKRLKNWVTINQNTLSEETSTDFAFDYLDISSVTTGRISKYPVHMRFADAPSRARRILQPGDTLVSTVRTYLKAVVTINEHNNPLIASTGFAVLSPRPGTFPKCLGYVAQSEAFTRQLTSESIGIAYPAISETRLGNIVLTLPPPAEQAAIVRFLDWAGGRLERTIRAKRRIIALLNEQKQAIIHRAVTRGLDPNVPLKDSGIPWLGEIPAHWEVRRAKYVFREVDVRSESGNETHLAMSQKLGLVPSNMVQSTLRSDSYAGAKLCEVGDLILNRLKAHLGVFASASIRGVISPDYSVFRRLIPANITFFETVLKSTACRGELRIRAKGIVEGFWRLYTDDFYDIVLPVPPLLEQDEIMNSISAKTHNQNTAISRLEREIALLREYRTRLISDVVTGKLDVRAAAASLPAEPGSDSLATDLDALEDDTVDALDATEEDV